VVPARRVMLFHRHPRRLVRVPFLVPAMQLAFLLYLVVVTNMEAADLDDGSVPDHIRDAVHPSWLPFFAKEIKKPYWRKLQEFVDSRRKAYVVASPRSPVCVCVCVCVVSLLLRSGAVPQCSRRLRTCSRRSN
jgi:hypothetical protein